ncbi:hypothetical protein GR157_00925 [Burkholderia sp. 4701]|nr:hypothetical protein [Burkholderia sp. 4701]MXN83138.1 hypothetical protein [Burkholderia sp. 4812]
MLEVAMTDVVTLFKRTLHTSAIVISLAMILAGCGGGDSGGTAATAMAALNAAPPSGFQNLPVVPHDATFQGKTYSEWEVSFWQWALAIPLPPDSPYMHPFTDCTNRPISAGQSGNVWYWSAPDLPDEICNQSATIIPAGTSIFLTMLDVEASSLDDPTTPFHQTTAAGQTATAKSFASDIRDVFCTIDGVPVENVTAFRTLTAPFSFSAPTPWVFGSVGGSGTAVGDGYFLLLKPLSAGSHTIHYGGKFRIPPGVFGPTAVEIPKDVTLLITVGS